MILTGENKSTENGWNDFTVRNYWQKTCPSGTLPTRNLTWTDPVLNPVRGSDGPATNSRRYY
jgi:hypothetical protein